MNNNNDNDSKKWGYKETGKKLGSRIDVQNNFGENDIDAWMLKLIKIEGNEKILDLGCGDGKQISAFGKKLGKGGKIVGCDISEELIEKAKESAVKSNIEVSLLVHDMDQSFPFKDGEFDLFVSFFSIYYSKNPSKLMQEIKRLLKEGGRLFIAGPTPDNTKDFWDLHVKVTGRDIPQVCLDRRARLNDIFIPLVKENFKNVKIDIFKNIIHFPSVGDVIKYYSSSLLLEESSRNEEEKKMFLNKMEKEVKQIIEKDGVFDMEKVVYGIIAFK